jgi:hypothetical protein
MLNVDRLNVDRLAPPSRALRRLALLGAALLLSACAAFQQVGVDVARFGQWPAGRAPGSFAFDRLPSQQDAGEPQQVLEESAQAALERAGFSRAPDAARADVQVQVGARTSRLADPPVSTWGGIGIRSGARVSGSVTLGFPIGRGAGGTYFGPPGWPQDYGREVREASLLLTDRTSRQVLLELRARTEARVGGDALLTPLFDAMLQGFPDLAPGSQRVTVTSDPAR